MKQALGAAGYSIKIHKKLNANVGKYGYYDREKILLFTHHYDVIVAIEIFKGKRHIGKG
jgi:hypothetical protein